jgi:hypothetical protein
MLYEKFIRLVEEHAEQLTKSWIKEVKNNPSTIGYKKMSDQLLDTRVYDVYKRLGNWVLQKDPSDKNTAEHFMKLGRERASEGLRASEVIYALILSRVVLWKYIINQGVINSAMDMQQALGFYQKVNNFFDKAAYFVAVGFESIHLEDQEKLKKEDFVEKAVKGVTKWFIKDLK